MASAVRATFSYLSSGRSDADSTPDKDVDKYRLLVTAGPTYNQKQHRVVPVNTDDPIIIDNDFITAKIVVRVRNFRGLPSVSPASCSYFDDPLHEKDQYSIGFSFVPKRDIPSVNTVWGNDFDHPIRSRLPPSFIINTAFRIVKDFIDPGLEIDAYADEPWVYGPSLSCWFGLRIGDKVNEDASAEPADMATVAAHPAFPAPSNEHVLTEGADGSGVAVRESLNLPENNEKRRKFFLDAAHRETFVFEKGRCYAADFYNPYIDFGNFLLKLPGFNLKVIKYVEDKTHCLRYVFKDRETGDVFFNVNFHLLWGDQLTQALEYDKLFEQEVGRGTGTSLQTVVEKPATGDPPHANGVHNEETTSGTQSDADVHEISEGVAGASLGEKKEPVETSHDDLD